MRHFNDSRDQFPGWLQSEIEQETSEQNEILKKVSTYLQEVSRDENPEAQAKIFELLATAMGKQLEERQTPLRESGLLESILTEMDASESPVELTKQSLRIIGNSVVDNDTNRELVTRRFGKLLDCLEKDDLIMIALVVVFNLCNDYDHAQSEAAHLRLDSVISGYLATNKIPEEAIDYATDLLTSTTEKLSVVQVSDAMSIKTFVNILNVATAHDEDHYHEYVDILTHYLQHPEFQQQVAKPEILDKLVDLVLDYEVRLAPGETQAVLHELSTQNDPEKPTSAETNVLLMAQLVNSLAAISATDTFVRDFSMKSPVVEKITSRLHSPATLPSTVCACVVLGNLATSDRVCLDMVENMRLHVALNDLLTSRHEPALLYAATGFVRHLAFPEANRSILGETGLIDACCRLLLHEDSSVRGEAGAILHKLVSNNSANIKRVVSGLVPEGVTPAGVSGVEFPDSPTVLYHIITQALVPSTSLPSMSMKNPMIEIGRTVVAILRYLSQTHAKEDAKLVAHQVYKTPLVARPVARLVRQRFYADARSEGLLGLGLLAQSQEGSVCVIKEIKEDRRLLDAIREFAVEQKTESQSGATAGRDYQNAVVLLHGLATNGVNAMDASMTNEVEALQGELSKLLI